MTIEAVQAGHNAIVLAPTAGGKTEAAMLPVVDLLHRHPSPPVGALYMSPLRALLNNQETRMEQLMRLGGMQAFKWHGDVERSSKPRFVEEPAHLLMITPESLEVILATPRYDKRALFGGLRFVVVDEIHAFAADDRGDHLIALLERLTEYAREDFQRIGLSATVSNAERLVEWLQGSSRREGVVVRPPREKEPRLIEVHPLSDEEDPASRAVALARGKKSLFFAESRGKTEKLKQALEEVGVRAFVHHSSVSRGIREETERAFRDAGACCIVCTSSLELGLDVGDLDLVLQLDAPSTVSSFLQRLGRTGRRPGTRGHMAFITDEEWSFLTATALVTLAARGWVEPVRPSTRSVNVFLHQVLARVLQHGGVARGRLLSAVGKPYCFSGLSVDEAAEMLDHLVATGVLLQVDGVLVFGPIGEKAFGRANFLELYAVFEAPRELTVRTTSNKAVGNLETWFAQSLGTEGFVFVLGGRPWQAVACDWDTGVLTVQPAPRGKIPAWMGTPRLLSREVCEAIRELLVGTAAVGFLAPPAQAVLDRLREKWGQLLRQARLVMQRNGGNVFLYTFAGGRINNVIGQVLKRECGVEAHIDNFWVRMRVPSAGGVGDAFFKVLGVMRGEGYFTEAVVAEMVKGMARGRLSKFQGYLPEGMEAGFVAERLMDVEGAVRVAGERVITAEG